MLLEPCDHRIDQSGTDLFHESRLRVRADRAWLVDVARTLERDIVDGLQIVKRRIAGAADGLENLLRLALRAAVTDLEADAAQAARDRSR